MAHLGSKGWYVQKLKEEFQVSRIDGKKLETYRAHVLHNYLYKELEYKDKSSS